MMILSATALKIIILLATALTSMAPVLLLGMWVIDKWKGRLW